MSIPKGLALWILNDCGDYGEGLRMPIISELVSLVHDSMKNRDHEKAKEVIRKLRRHWFVGDTGILSVSDGIFVQDYLNLKAGRISMDEKTLKDRLGKHEEKGVVFSDDMTVRFFHHKFKKEPQSPSAFLNNSGTVALVGGEENAEKFARAFNHCILNPRFGALPNGNSSQIRVAGLGSGSYNLGIVADISAGQSGYSFGVKKGYVNGIREPKEK